MEPSDRTAGAPALHPTWTALGHRLAVTVGAGTALFGLLRHVPLRIACLRGALAWLAVITLFRVCRALLDRAPAPEALLQAADEPPNESPA